MTAIIEGDLAIDLSQETSSFTLFQREACKETPLSCWIAHPRFPTPQRPPLVAIHGIRRGAEDQAALLAARAAAQGRSVIAPLFDEASWPRYQQVVRKGRADRALIALMQALRREGLWRTERFALTGFSGGAQFAHRFAMLHPRMVAELSVASAGWYTFPDDAVFPYGMGNRPNRWPDWGERFAANLDCFLSLPIRVAVVPRTIVAMPTREAAMPSIASRARPGCNERTSGPRH